MDEARSILYFLSEVVVRRTARAARRRRCGAAGAWVARSAATDAPVRFGSWVGGDRDGNPNVTPATTLEVLEFQRTRALRILID